PEHRLSPVSLQGSEAKNDSARKQIGGDEPETSCQPDKRVAQRPDMGSRGQQLAYSMAPVAPGHPGACAGCQRPDKEQVVADEHAVTWPENNAQRQVIASQQPGRGDNQRSQPERDVAPCLYL